MKDGTAVKHCLPRVKPYLVRVAGLDGSHQYMLMPTHSATNLELVFRYLVNECLPSPAIDTVMYKPPTTGYGDVSSIW
jgi:hypothetical protein